MKSSTTPGQNRTGMATSPIHALEMLDVPQHTQPTSPAARGEDGLAAERKLYARKAEPMGSMPPPGSLKELVSTTVKALQGEKATVFIDKLGERMAFERSGTRLYEAVLSKFDAFGTWKGGPSRDDLKDIHDEELQHFGLLKDAIEQLGSDPTAVTPSADVQAVASMGWLQVAADARADLRQTLEMALIAELADNASWEDLIALARQFKRGELADRFEAALATEREHLRKVRRWLGAALSLDAVGKVQDAFLSAGEPRPDRRAAADVAPAASRRKPKSDVRRPARRASAPKGSARKRASGGNGRGARSRR